MVVSVGGIFISVKAMNKAEFDNVAGSVAYNTLDDKNTEDHETKL
jgi:hypothetical protein